jgi:hypothetical protein
MLKQNTDSEISKYEKNNSENVPEDEKDQQESNDESDEEEDEPTSIIAQFQSEDVRIHVPSTLASYIYDI